MYETIISMCDRLDVQTEEIVGILVAVLVVFALTLCGVICCIRSVWACLVRAGIFKKKKFVGYQPIKELGINDIIKRFAFSRLLDISQSES